MGLPSVLRARVEGFNAGKTFNHAPGEAGTSKAKEGFVPVDLSAEQRAVLVTVNNNYSKLS